MPAERRDLVRIAVKDIVRQDVRDDELLVSSGRIDSLSVLKLILALEDRLKLSIPPDKVQPEDFDSVNAILDTLERVLAA
jgi:acyl carrier protein